MASLVQHESGVYRLRFRYDGLRFNRSLGTSSEKAAQGEKASIEQTLELLKQGRLILPDGATPDEAWHFFRTGGKQTALPSLGRGVKLGQVVEEYFDSLPDAAKELSSISTERTHCRNFERHLGKGRVFSGIEAGALEQYIGKRQKDNGLHGRKIQPATIKKELETFRLLWSFAARRGYTNAVDCPCDDVRRPRSDEKPPFKTFDEIEKIIGHGDLKDVEIRELWECLFLRDKEILQLLQDVKKQAASVVYPLIAIAAFTGARRSEILRSEVDDFDFKSGYVLLREKKRRTDVKISFRRVDLHKRLTTIIRAWLKDHPGGRFTICNDDRTTITRDQANHYFKQAVADSKWKVVRGFHVLRHSFASNCARKGIHEAIIDAWMGHQTDDMRRRYRHLFPEDTRKAMQSLF